MNIQNLDVISVNIWDILISLINLVLLFLILKKFLYKPVKKVIEKRNNEINEQYSSAEKAQIQANESKLVWEEKLSTAQREADDVLHNATETAKLRGDTIIDDAQKKADSIIRMAENEAQLQKKKAEDEIKKEIVEVSSLLSEKILEREINKDDHRSIIDSFIDNIGDSDE